MTSGPFCCGAEEGGGAKTYALSQALWWESWRAGPITAHYLAPTKGDVRGTIFEGQTGLCSVIPAECLYGGSLEKAYNKSTHEIRLSNGNGPSGKGGSVIKGFATTEEGERLRGPQCSFLAGDELAAWDKPAGNLEKSFHNAMLGCRIAYPDGTPARAVFGTTPRPVPFLKRLEKRPDVIVVHGTTYENLRNLSATFKNEILSLAGTLLGKQEIEAGYIDEETDLSIFKRSWFRLFPYLHANGQKRKLPHFVFIVESYDTAFEEENYDNKTDTVDYSAKIVFGVFNVAQVFTEDEIKRLGCRSKYAVLICDFWQEKLGFPDLLDRARKEHRTKWGDPGRKADVVLIENKGSGISLRQSLAAEGVMTWPYNPMHESKTTRAHAASPIVAQHMVFVPESKYEERKGLPRDWVEPLLEQICMFRGPGSVEHDDGLDCFVQALLYLRNRDIIALPAPKLIDAEEKREKEEREAARIAEQSKPVSNPYG